MGGGLFLDRSHFMAACTEFPELEELVMEVAVRLPDPSSLYSRPSESCCLLPPAQEVLEQCIQYRIYRLSRWSNLAASRARYQDASQIDCICSFPKTFDSILVNVPKCQISEAGIS